MGLVTKLILLSRIFIWYYNLKLEKTEGEKEISQTIKDLLDICTVNMKISGCYEQKKSNAFQDHYLKFPKPVFIVFKNKSINFRKLFVKSSYQPHLTSHTF